MSNVALAYIDNSALRRYSFIFSIHSNGSSTDPPQNPFTNTFVSSDSSRLEHSHGVFIAVFSRNHWIMGSRVPVPPLDMWVAMASVLCNPIFAPSGVSMGSMNPHCEL